MPLHELEERTTVIKTHYAVIEALGMTKAGIPEPQIEVSVKVQRTQSENNLGHDSNRHLKERETRYRELEALRRGSCQIEERTGAVLS